MMEHHFEILNGVHRVGLNEVIYEQRLEERESHENTWDKSRERNSAMAEVGAGLVCKEDW